MGAAPRSIWCSSGVQVGNELWGTAVRENENRGGSRGLAMTLAQCPAPEGGQASAPLWHNDGPLWVVTEVPSGLAGTGRGGRGKAGEGLEVAGLLKAQAREMINHWLFSPRHSQIHPFHPSPPAGRPSPARPGPGHQASQLTTATIPGDGASRFPLNAKDGLQAGPQLGSCSHSLAPAAATHASHPQHSPPQPGGSDSDSRPCPPAR